MAKQYFSSYLDVGLFCVVGVVLLALIALLASSLTFQYMNYREGIGLALGDESGVNHASILTYSRAWDFAVAKTSALFLSFVMIFTGALYVLRSAEARFEALVENGPLKGSLSVSSPGLAMVALGAFLVAFVISTQTKVDYTQHRSPDDSFSNGTESVKPNKPKPRPAEGVDKRKED